MTFEDAEEGRKFNQNVQSEGGDDVEVRDNRVFFLKAVLPGF